MFIVNCPPVMSELTASLTAPEPAVVPFSAGRQKEVSRRDTDDLLSSVLDHTSEIVSPSASQSEANPGRHGRKP